MSQIVLHNNYWQFPAQINYIYWKKGCASEIQRDFEVYK